MMNGNAMKRGIDLMASLGWMCVIVATFMLLGSSEINHDYEFRKIAIMVLAVGFYILAPGTLIDIGSTILRLSKRKRVTK